MIEFYSDSPETTEKIGQKIAKALKGNEVIAMYGGLGMGKTALTRGIAAGLGTEDCVSSPTFALVNEYEGRCKIYHFDMYRINGIDDLYAIGFFDYLDTGVLIIEWSENIADALPDDCITIKLRAGNDENSRVINVEGVDV
ncbi:MULTISPECIES: tRNA (adenosine(37)-N6)-threonylcarbamoyltransferase complex ATPase subunit type 1 TsaE [unclassified Ruminococcus]|uniref:tRNA (adenosine(37)-N6)-threonylcarbamoyltransferase complex ATPase subunit type 1 TsaE n=1 Tax=unclassified Ruminococcus TaxID=2608920 RepID=UPI00210E8A81|nr:MULTISPECIES: tRNA (adenosine(37)-N6)-threonylcarbamoyltransferase complex ATPase subunit type 1 TsaE [unclassified Ruminococcus]MCQ4022430.1 tRNA (adenosine(37)-N6)-threonylcarbamoyltransferase complex ATPase subunit type 1 TsaE [Ruminococcus sp. zg-924]MCQ4114758.1 tRNA (adenosine(37)-N6)-threonylcarbamoyltransferase complex ATPase subunit type 1 TsaE [Ruminococcus sp. zg-921]